MNELSTDFIVYSILLMDYLKQNGINYLDDEKLIKEARDFLPIEWETNYSLDEKIKILGDAIKNKKNLREYAKGDLIFDKQDNNIK